MNKNLNFLLSQSFALNKIIVINGNNGEKFF